MRSAHSPSAPVNPARAGMILADNITIEILKSKPRASGDDPKIAATAGQWLG